MVIGSAKTINVCRIQRYLEAKKKPENKQIKLQKEQDCSQEQPCVSFIVFLNTTFRGLVALMTNNRVGFGYYLAVFEGKSTIFIIQFQK